MMMLEKFNSRQLDGKARLPSNPRIFRTTYEIEGDSRLADENLILVTLCVNKLVLDTQNLLA